MPLRIKDIHCRTVEHALRAGRIVVSPAGRHDRSVFVEVTLTDADGLRGYGEAATMALWSGESPATARWAIEEAFAPKLRGATFDHPREALAVMDGTAYGNPFAKSAVDTALWDLWAKQQGKRAVELFADRAPAPRIPTRASVGCYDVAETVRLAREFWGEGVRTLKFKVGAPRYDDAARLRAAREALGDAPVFTIDANGGYATEDDAVRAIEALLPFDLALVEQPTPRDRLQMLARVRRRVSVPIMADEGVFTPGDLGEALDCDAFDILSVYPGKNGGFTRAIDMARAAQTAGKACAIGSNLETDLGQAAMAALASGLSAFPVDRLACDLPGVIFYERSSTSPPLAFREGAIEPPAGLGFGVEPVA